MRNSLHADDKQERKEESADSCCSDYDVYCRSHPSPRNMIFPENASYEGLLIIQGSDYRKIDEEGMEA